MTTFAFDNSFARELPAAYTAWQPVTVPAPALLYFNTALAQELGLDAAALNSPEGAALFAGNRLPEGAQPLAQVYAGHQFGGFSPRLGDGRALLLGELMDRLGRRRDIAFKGSGRTPYSRGGDGKAAVGPMLREVIMGEALHALGIASTRALAVAATGERVYRDAAGALPGAVLTRVAASHIRVGSFQYFAARGEWEPLRRLAGYTLARHDPDLLALPDPPRLQAWLRAVAQRQARLLAQWMNVGFIHGVMNTDNMAISGETIDYGPCAFLEAYDPATVFSSIDHGGRYAYGNQPHIARWNLARLAEAVLPLMVAGRSPDDEPPAEAEVQHAVALATEVIDGFPPCYAQALLQGQRAKLGLQQTDAGQDAADTQLAADWLELLQTQRADFTLAWYRLGDAASGELNPLRALLAEPAALEPWLQRWQTRCALEDAGADPQHCASARRQRIRAASPWVIPRNHRVEEALAAASDEGDLGPFQALLDAVRRPFDDSPAQAHFAQPAPAHVTAAYQTFCGT